MNFKAGLITVAVVACVALFFTTIFAVALGIRAVHDRNPAAGVTLGIVAVAVALFLVGSWIDWDDDGIGY